MFQLITFCAFVALCVYAAGLAASTNIFGLNNIIETQSITISKENPTCNNAISIAAWYHQQAIISKINTTILCLPMLPPEVDNIEENEELLSLTEEDILMSSLSCREKNSFSQEKNSYDYHETPESHNDSTFIHTRRSLKKQKRKTNRAKEKNLIQVELDNYYLG